MKLYYPDRLENSGFIELPWFCPRRTPDWVIGRPSDPYLLRWYILPRNRFFNIYLHCLLQSDDARALHDHPWENLSIILKGAYVEVLKAHADEDSGFIRIAGDFIFRRARTPHRLIYITQPCWSLFLTGPKRREWGFHCPRGWVHWKHFTQDGSPNRIGPGCDQPSENFQEAP